MEDVRPGMRLPGIVTNVTAFGAFVDIGVHQDGLVHISEISDRFVKDPAEVVKVHQKVMVTVLAVDLERRRIGLSLKGTATGRPKEAPKREKAEGPRTRTPAKPSPKPPRRDTDGPIGDRLQIRLH